jgi:hypothetical protein
MNVAENCARALGKLDDVGVVVLLQDAPSKLGPQQAARCANLLQAVARGSEAAGKPLVALSNLSDEPHAELGRVAREAGVPYLRGTREGLSATARYAVLSAPCVICELYYCRNCATYGRDPPGENRGSLR